MGTNVVKEVKWMRAKGRDRAPIDPDESRCLSVTGLAADSGLTDGPCPDWRGG